MYHCCTIVYNTGNPNAVLANRMIRCIYAVLATKIIRCIYLYSSVFMGRFGRDLNLISQRWPTSLASNGCFSGIL